MYKHLIHKLRTTRSVSKRQMLDDAADAIERLAAERDEEVAHADQLLDERDAAIKSLEGLLIAENKRDCGTYYPCGAHPWCGCCHIGDEYGCAKAYLRWEINAPTD